MRGGSIVVSAITIIIPALGTKDVLELKDRTLSITAVPYRMACI